MVYVSEKIQKIQPFMNLYLRYISKVSSPTLFLPSTLPTIPVTNMKQ